MAQAKQRPSTQDRIIVMAARTFCAEAKAFGQLCQQYDNMPDDLADACFKRMKTAKRRALKVHAATMEGVMAKARMVEAWELFDTDPLIASTIRDLLAVVAEAARPVVPLPVERAEQAMAG